MLRAELSALPLLIPTWLTSQWKYLHSDLVFLPTTASPYFGPFNITNNRTTKRRRGLLFTCSLLVLSMRKSSHPWTLIRMLWEKSSLSPVRYSCHDLVKKWCSVIGAKRELQENIEKWKTNNIDAELVHKSIQWRLNSPNALHQTGFWEFQPRTRHHPGNTWPL